MTNLKKFFSALTILLIAVFSIFPQPVFASQSKYFDYGPYYSTPSVLGLSLSNLENLPAPKLPDSAMPAPAKGILPGSVFYGLERAWENTQLTFTFNSVAKEQLRLRQTEERLSEAKTLMDQGKIQAASQALGDYGKAIDSIAQNLAAIAQTNTPASQDLINKVEQAVAAQTVVAIALSLSTSPAQAENWTDAGNTAREVLDKIAEVRGEPAIPENLSNGLQELKEQGLISEEESNKLYSLKSRSEVREELVKLNSASGLPPSEITRLDTSVTKFYPEVQNQQIANWEVVELRSYQAQPQPTEKQIEELQRWQSNQNVPPSNDIKPYLWYNRARDLAQEVDLSNFSQTQQTDLVKYYPEAQNNSTYSPPPATSPSPAPTGASAASPTTAASPTDDQTVTPSPVASPSPSATPVPADPYVQDPGSLPGQPTYIIKQLGEGLGLAFTFDPADKAKLKFEQAERRLAEAAALSNDPKKAALYESTLKNYQQTLNDGSNYVKDFKDPRLARKIAQRLEAQAARHEVIFEKGLLPPPAQNPKLLAEVIKTTEDALDKSADALNHPAIPSALASRLDDLQAQGLILKEEAQSLINSNSREEAREKIRELVEQKGFPLADAKKMDEAQSRTTPADYNQLVEVRKVEELQNLRAVQTELAQTPTFKIQVSTLGQKEATLTNSFDPTLITVEDLGGRENLVKTYTKLAAIPQPINSGQFGAEATPGAKPAATSPSPRDAVLTTCPEGATFKQFEGCVWADSGKKINDYDQYKCEGPRQYYSFAARKCVIYELGEGFGEDSQPTCPVTYVWSWQTQSCQSSTGGILPYPSPSAQPEPKDDKEREERSKRCPEGSSYQAPNGCVWDKNGKSVYDTEQYRCGGRGQYYSFGQQKCVAAPKEGEPYPKDTTPACKEEGTYWNWSQSRCLKAEKTPEQETKINIDEFKPPFIAPNSPFYIIKQAAERAQLAIAFTTPAKSRVTLNQAKERLVEAADALKRNDPASFKKSVDSYTAMMQDLVSDTSKEQLNEGVRKEIGKILSESSVEQNLLLEKLQAWAPKEQDTPLSAAVSVTILGVDKAADIAGEPAIPDEVKSKIESLPEDMISEVDKKKLLEIDSRVDARLKLGSLIQNGALTQTEASFLNEDFAGVDQNAKLKVEELKKLEEIATASENKDKLVEKVTKNEDIARQLAEFERTFEAGNEIPAQIRSYVRLTRINEVAQTIRPDIVKLEDFQNRKDVLLAVATLQEEFKPTKESWARVEDFRRRNPGTFLPPELARIEALSFSLGVRNQAETCYLPTPPFPANTPCPAPGAAIQITSYANYVVDPADRDFPVYGGNPTTDKNGNPLVYGQGPKPEKAGACQDGYHWMYDSGGWCMSNSGNYNSSYNYAPSGPQTAGYTPYSPYYNAPGAPPAAYPGSPYSYSAPSYYGPASTYYTTTPPSGTVPGSGPRPTSPGQCPSGFHWMSDSGGWCMANGNTYVAPGTPDFPAGTATTETGSYNCGSQPYDPVTKKCKDGACPGGFNWDGSKCVAGYYLPGTPGGGSSGGSTPWCWSAFLSPEATTCVAGSYWDSSSCSCKSSGGGVNCGSGYTWNGYSCQPSSGSGSNCTYPSGGCPGTGAWYDYSSCSCKTSTSYSSPSSYQYGCTPGYYWDGSKCTAGSNEGSGWSDTAARSGTYCQPPSGGCGSGWFDYGSCSCKQSSSQGCYNVSASSCGSGWYFDSAACTCRQSSTSGGATSGGSSSGGSSGGSCPSGYHWMDNSWCMSDAARDGGGGTSGSGSTTSGGSSSSGSSGGSCPSGSHWMSENGGYCMQDGGGSGSSGGGTTSTPAPAPTTTEPAPAPASEPAPAPAAPSEPAPAPSGG